MKRPLPLLLLLGLVSGILIARYITSSIVSSLIVFGVGVLLFGLLRFTRVSRLGYRLNTCITLLQIFFLSAGLGMFSRILYAPCYPVDSRHYLNSQTARVIDITSKTTGDLLLVELLDHNVKSSIFVPCSSVKRGDLILIKSNLYPVDSARSTVVKKYDKAKKNQNRYENERYTQYLLHKGILYSGRAKTEDIKTIDYRPSFLCIAMNVRDDLEIAIEKTGLSEKVKHFLITILLGDKGYIDEDLRNKFSDVGLSHILAVSGLHTGIIAGIFLFLLYPFHIIKRRRLKYIATLLLLWIFVILTGCAPSTVRAAIMMTFLFIGFMTERYTGAVSGLCWAAFFILLLSPESLFDPGFQLSFLCVGGILLFCEKLNPINRTTHSGLHSLSALLLTSIVSTVCTWPVVAYYFGKVPTMFLSANILILPFLPVYILAALLYFLLNAFGINVSILTYLLESGYSLTENLSSYLSSEGSTSLSIQPSLISVYLWLAGLILTAVFLHARGNRKIYASLGLILLGGSIITIILPT